MRLVDIAKRRQDGLIDPQWVEGLEAFRAHRSPRDCPYPTNTEEFSSWMEGWLAAGGAGLLEEPKLSLSLQPSS
jgi:ribosome modulation factor